MIIIKPHSHAKRKAMGAWRARAFRVIWMPLLLLAGMLGPPAAQGSSLIYKNYIVRYDRGWDILCEPYVVQRGDWVLKIFRQKGEIANQDFRDFLSIFQRLNPHVPDVDLVRPGQAIDIPLRKLEHGALPGQDNGVVTIPIVSLSKVTDILPQKAEAQAGPYEVQRGDTISQIVARRYGRYGGKAYREGIQKIQAANPQITDINRIFAGQKIYMPDPATRERQGQEAVADGIPGSSGLDPTAASQDRAWTSGPEAAPPATTPEAAPDPLSAAAATVGGKLIGKGTYYVPREGRSDFEIDLSRHPLMELGRHRLFFSQDGKIMGQAPELLEKQWPQAKVVPYGKEDSAQEIIAAIFDSVEDEDNTPSVVAFEDQGVHVAVRARWIKPESDSRRLCITPIQAVAEQTPESMRRYLEQNGLVLKEVLPGGTLAAATADGGSRHAVKNILALTPTSQRDFMQRLSRALHFSYAPNVPVTFPYAGIQIEAFANLVATLDGREVLLDFGELYGGAAKAIQESGLKLVQLGAEENHLSVAGKLLDGLGARTIKNPSFQAAPRPAVYNTTVTIQGLLYTDTENKRMLLSGAPLHPAVTDMLSAEGIGVITW